METIKCSKCGCEMSAMSEACPLCCTPTVHGQSSNIKLEAEVTTVTVSETSHEVSSPIPMCTLNSFDECKSLEEAIIKAAGHRKQNPMEFVAIWPIDNETPLQPFFENGMIMIGECAVTNRVDIYYGVPNTEYLTSIEDCHRHANALKSLFAKDGISNVDVGYTFGIDSIWGNLRQHNVVDVELCLSSTTHILMQEIEKFNQIDYEAGGHLSFDSETNTLKGTVKTFPSKGGIFEKRRIKKANEAIENAFYDLMTSICQYLE